MNLSTNSNEINESLLDSENKFESMGLDIRILKAVKKLGFIHPTLVQSKSIPLSLQGKDILAKARTGSGKTAAYSIPIIQKILNTKEKSNVKGVKAIVLVPSKELCEQVYNHFIAVSYYASHLVSILHLGNGKSIDEQRGLLRDIPDVIISTPTTLVSHLQNKSMLIESTLEMLVIDEADLVLSYGYQEDISTLKSFLPKVCQCFIMSATLTPQVEELKKLVLHTPAILKLEEDQAIQTNLSEYSIRCSTNDKYLLVFSLLRLKLMQGKILFFVNDTDSCYKLKLFLDKFQIKSAVINSELPINTRYDIILQFNKGIFDYLIATDESFKSSSSMEIKDEEISKLKEEPISDDDIKKEENDSDSDSDSDSEGSFGSDSENEKDDEDEEDDEEEVKIKDEPLDSDDETINNEDGEEIEIKEEPLEGDQGISKKSKKSDTEYNVARGIDFKNVDIVVNFDFPRTIKSYIHRIGRTARGNNKGIAISFVTLQNEPVVKNVEKKRSLDGYNLKPFEFKISAIEGFRYRVEDVLRTLTKGTIKVARSIELKTEILNSEKLKQHFQANPQDVLALKHDNTLIKVDDRKFDTHLKNIPDYLLPNQFKSNNGLKVVKTDKQNRPVTDGSNNVDAKKKRKSDVLNDFNYPKLSKSDKQLFTLKKYKISANDIDRTGNLTAKPIPYKKK